MSRTKKKKAKNPRNADTNVSASLQGDGEEKVRDAPPQALASAEGSLDSNTSTGDTVVAVERRMSDLWNVWNHRPHPVLKKVGAYVLDILGVYWILAAWFSAWGDTWLGCAWWTFVGVVLVYAGIMSQAEYASRDDVLEAAKLNVRSGTRWFFGGLVVSAVITFLGAGHYFFLLCWGPIAFGGIQLLHGLAQKHGLINVK